MSSDPIIEDIKSKVDIADIIGSYITLRQSGTNLKGLCPFHGEKTPSFMVNKQRQLFRCFGCSEHGDVFAFVMKQENIDFPAALQLLAAKAGVTLPEKTRSNYPKGSGVDKPNLYRVNELATKLFHHILTQHSLGESSRAYLKSRGVTDESIKTFLIGYAPASSTALSGLLQKHGLSASAIKAAGSPERFRNRLMFPFRDVIGNVVGFSGRAHGDQIPKYLNTAETELFHKNRYIYGLYEAKKSIGVEKKIVMVEGQLDLVLAHQVGTYYAVATSGTALTNEHLVILRRYADTVVFAFDADDAGKKATERAISLALPHGFDVSIVVLPDGTDPGEVIATHPEVWKKALATPLPAIEWLFRHFFTSEKKASSVERTKIYDALFPYIELLDDVVSRTYTLQRLALLLGVTQEKIISEAFDTWKAKQSKKERPSMSGEATPEPIAPLEAPLKEGTLKERGLVGLLLLHPHLLQYKEFVLRAQNFTNTSLGSLYTEIVNWYNKNTTQSAKALISYVETTLPDVTKQSLQKLLFDTQSSTADYTQEQVLQEYSLLVQAIRHRGREERIQNYAHLIAQAESDNNRERVIELMKQMSAKAEGD